MSASLEYLTRQISLSPEVQAKLREELCVEHGGSFKTYADLDKFPYLHAVVMEGLRLVYTINFYQPRVVPRGGCTIENIYLPEGVRIHSRPQRLISTEAVPFLDCCWVAGISRSSTA